MRKRTRQQARIESSMGEPSTQVTRLALVSSRSSEESTSVPMAEDIATPSSNNDINLENSLAEARAEVQALRSQLTSTRNQNLEGNRHVNWAMFKDDRLIPRFDPADPTQSIDGWLHRVDECAAAYHWDEMTKVYVALGKLEGMAKVWYDGLRSTQFSWGEWETMLRNMFPVKTTFGKLFYEAAVYRSRTGQDLNEYCFHKLAKLNKLKLNLTQNQIVDCIVEGIQDPQIRLNVKAARCTTFVELIDYATNFPGLKSMDRSSAKGEMKPDTSVGNKLNKELVCFGCGERGHKRTQCVKFRGTKCTFCSKIGHVVEDCRLRKKGQTDRGDKQVKYVGQGSENKYHMKAKIRNQVVSCIIDTGSELTIIKKSVAIRLGLTLNELEEPIKLRGFEGTIIIAKTKSSEVIQIGDVSVNTDMVILQDDEVVFDLLIGQNFIDHPTVLVINNGKQLIVTRMFDEQMSLSRVGDKFSVNLLEVVKFTNEHGKRELVCGEISNIEKNQLREKLDEYRDRFSLDTAELGKTSTTSMKIECIVDKPICYKPYRLSLTEREKVKTIVDELLRNKIIRPSRSPYASPIILVPKKNGESRMCVDFRALNRITKKDKFPLPRIDDQIDRLGGNKYFTMLDLSQGFYQIPLEETSISKTGFVTPDGHYEFLRMPFGLANAPSEFQRLMSNVLEGYIDSIVQVYIDDLIIPAKSFEEGLKRLEMVLLRLREHNLTLNMTKCKFFFSSIEYLGREISEKGVRPGLRKIVAVRDMPEPANQKQLRQFLGLAGYFRKFVEKFAVVAEPLTKLLRKNVVWKFGDEQKKAFLSIKDLLVKRPILQIFNPELRTEVHTDASKLGVAGILFQINDRVKSRNVVCYFSRQTTTVEQNYHSYHLETLAVVESLRHFRVYLIGIHFTLVTDCAAIRSTSEKKDILPRVARWWMEMQDFDFEIQYRSGLKMNHVDCLSRNPVKTVFAATNITESEWLLAAQMQDEDISLIRKILLDRDNRENNKQYFTWYELKDDIVYRKLEDGGKKWLVPKANRWQICRLCHDDLGHFGVDKTLAKIRENYYFPQMRSFVSKYVGSCLNCLYYKKPSGKRPGELHPIDKVAVPFHTLHIDHVGPFVQSKRKHSQILVVVDGFTKFVILEAVRNTKAKYVIKMLDGILDIFGAPARIISDRGAAFTSRSFEDYCKRHGIKHVTNAVATPRANGQCERNNRTIISSLAALNGGMEDSDWYLHVKTVQRGINTTMNRTTGATPTELLLGINARSVPEGIILSEVQEDLNRLPLAEVRERAKNNITKDQEKQKKRYDIKRSKAPSFPVGTLVLIKITSVAATGESKKLLPKYRGPYKIVAVLPNDRYQVEDMRGRLRRKTVVAVDSIKPWITLRDEAAE